MKIICIDIANILLGCCIMANPSLSAIECTVIDNKTANTLSLKNDTDVAHYNFNAHQPISVIFDRGIAERIGY